MLHPHLRIDAPLAAAALAAMPWAGGWPLGAAALAAGGLHALAVAHPRNAWYGPVTWRLPRSLGRACLTFDDGPDPTVTPVLLDLLARHGVTATFFLIGENARRHPDLVRRLRREGHTLGLHSDRHSRWFCAWSAARVRADLQDNLARVADLTGEAPPVWFRPPVGLRNPRITRVARDLGLRLITWTATGRDTRPLTTAAILARLQPGLVPGGILVLHDGVEPNRGPARTACLAVTKHLLMQRPLAFGPLPDDRLCGDTTFVPSGPA